MNLSMIAPVFDSLKKLIPSYFNKQIHQNRPIVFMLAWFFRKVLQELDFHTNETSSTKLDSPSILGL